MDTVVQFVRMADKKVRLTVDLDPDAHEWFRRACFLHDPPVAMTDVMRRVVDRLKAGKLKLADFAAEKEKPAKTTRD